MQHLQDCWRLWLRLQGDRPGWVENNVWVPLGLPLCHLTLSAQKVRLYHPDEGPAGVRIGSFVMSKRKCRRKHGLDLLAIYSNSHWFKSLKITYFAWIWSELGSGVVGLEDLQRAKWGYSSTGCCECSLPAWVPALRDRSWWDEGEMGHSSSVEAAAWGCRRSWITAIESVC